MLYHGHVMYSYLFSEGITCMLMLSLCQSRYVLSLSVSSRVMCFVTLATALAQQQKTYVKF
jgi:hypothetical protein